MSWNQVKFWVIINSFVTNPYGKYWSASVTLGGMDVNGTGSTIEESYVKLTTEIMLSAHSKMALEKIVNK